jgi:flagellar transcriptional activator FlhD
MRPRFPGAFMFDNLTQIRELNLSYLLLARRLLDEDRVAAMVRLNLSEPVADIISALTPAQTRRIADSTDVIWQLRLDNIAVLSALVDLQNESAATSHLHAAIILAEEPCTRNS